MKPKFGFNPKTLSYQDRKRELCPSSRARFLRVCNQAFATICVLIEEPSKIETKRQVSRIHCFRGTQNHKKKILKNNFFFEFFFEIKK